MLKGAEVEVDLGADSGLAIQFAGGWEDTALAKGARAVDLMDRTAGNPDWMVVKPFVTKASNCILPTYVVAAAAERSRWKHMPYACSYHLSSQS